MTAAQRDSCTAKMKHQLDELNNDIELNASGESSWDAMVAEMEKIRDAFSHSYKDFKAQVKAPTAS